MCHCSVTKHGPVRAVLGAQCRPESKKGAEGKGGIIGRSCHKSRFLPRQKFCRNEHVFCRDKSMLVVTNVLPRKTTTHLLLRQTFAATNTILSRQNTSFVATKICLSRQNRCRDKHVFVATKVLSRQAYFCRTNTCDKHVCRDKNDSCISSRQCWGWGGGGEGGGGEGGLAGVTFDK